MSDNRDPVTMKRMGALVAFSALLAIFVGSLGLAGWLFHAPLLKTMLVGQSAIKANTCISFILIGYSLWLQRRGLEEPPDAKARRRAQVAAGIAATIGLLSSSELLFGWDIGIDQLLFVESVEEVKGSVRPGLMSPISAVDFFLIGCALLVLGERTRRGAMATQSFAAAAAIVSLFGVIDLALVGHGAHTHIAPQTALTFLVFSSSLLCVRTDHGVGALLVDESLGGVLLRKLLPLAVGIPLFIAWAGWEGFEAGLYSEWMGVALMMVSSAALLAGVTTWGTFVVDRTIRERKRIEDELRSTSLYARSLIEANLDPLVTISADGKITDVNRATEEATGVARGQLIGSDFATYFTEPEKARQGYQQVFAKGIVTDYALTMRHRDGRLTEVLYNASIYKDAQGEVLGAFAAARNVTEFNRTLREFAETKNFLDNILQSSTKYSIIGKDLDQRVLSWNEGARQNYGYEADEIIGKKSSILHVPEDLQSGAVDRLLATAYERGLAEGEFERVRKDGSHFMANVVVTRRNDASGKPIGYLLVSNDISEKKKAEERLRASSLYARSLIEASLDPLVTISAEGKITDVNQATEQATGVAREKLIGSDFSTYFTEPEKAKQGYQQVLSSGFVRDYPLSLRHVSGKVTDVVYNASLFKDEQGKVQGVFAAARDVTERKRVEEGLRIASLYSRSLIEASLDPLVTISAEGTITDVNQATEQATGVAREKLIGSDFSSYFTEPEKAKQGYQQVLSSGFVRDYPLSLRHVSGKVTDVLYNASLFKDEAGKVQGVFAAARDVTERKRIEDELRSASLYSRSLIEASLDPLVTISAEGKITDVNQATEQATGVAREKLVGSDFSSYFTEAEKARQGYRQVLAQGFVRDYPLTLRRPSGESMEVLYNASVFRNPAGAVQGVFAAARDITERKRLERQIQERSENLVRVITETQEAVRVLTSSASDILTTVSELATSATEAASAVSETTTTVEEVKQTAQLSSQKAKDIAESSQNAARALQTGQSNVEASVAEMNRIREQTESIAETIVTLSEQSQAIGEITGSVNELAEQSNLLAVNAAIEAAKAGEQGKGFAVVAREIRSLAEQSKQATSQVRGLLADVQKAIGNAVMATEQASQVVESGVKQSHEAGESIRTAVEATVNVAKISGQIAASSQQQLVGVDQVAIAMESINLASRQVADSLRQVESVAQNLHELSQKLKLTVEQQQG